MKHESSHQLEVLVGNDLYGNPSKSNQIEFMQRYGNLDARFDFVSTPEDFANQIKKEYLGHGYDAVILYLDWKPGDSSGGKPVRCRENDVVNLLMTTHAPYTAPARVLYTDTPSEMQNARASLGATSVLGISASAEEMAQAIDPYPARIQEFGGLLRRNANPTRRETLWEFKMADRTKDRKMNELCREFEQECYGKTGRAAREALDAYGKRVKNRRHNLPAEERRHSDFDRIGDAYRHTFKLLMHKFPERFDDFFA